MPGPIYLSINEFPGDGVTTQYEFNFAGGYLERAHVKAYVQDENGGITEVVVTDSMFVNDTTLDLAVAAPVGGHTRIYRETPRDLPLVDFSGGARVTEANLDRITRQAILAVAEAFDAGAYAAVNDLLGQAGIAAAAAAASAGAASTSAGAASVSAGQAADQVTLAANQVALAAGQVALAAAQVDIAADYAASINPAALAHLSGAAFTGAISAPNVIAQALNGGPLGGHRNKLVNGDFTVNQLVKSGTVALAAGEYGHDCWKGGASGCTYTFASSGGITTLTITAGSLVNVVEGAFLQTGTHTLSWTGTAQGKIGAGSYSASGVTGAATAGTNMSIEFNTGTLALVQFEPGSIATPFEHRADQLQRCQRYCWKTYAQGTAPGTATQDGARGCSNTVTTAYGAVMTLWYPVEMQASPSVTFYNPITGASGTWRAASADYAMGFASVARGTNGALVGNSAAIPTSGLTLFGHALVEARL